MVLSSDSLQTPAAKTNLVMANQLTAICPSEVVKPVVGVNIQSYFEMSSTRIFLRY